VDPVVHDLKDDSRTSPVVTIRRAVIANLRSVRGLAIRNRNTSRRGRFWLDWLAMSVLEDAIVEVCRHLVDFGLDWSTNATVRVAGK
jgi:hypothetical protein